MRTVRLTAISFVFAALFAVSAYAQAGAAPAKVMFINTNAFASKEGIKKYADLKVKLETEFKPLQTELTNSRTRLQTLMTEIKGLEDKLNAPANTAVPIKRDDLERQYRNKAEEAQTLDTDIKRKAEDGQKKFERRQMELLSPISEDIGIAMEEFAKKNGYTVIMDSSKLFETGVLLVSDEKSDVTKEFITFYNARPATTAAVTRP